MKETLSIRPFVGNPMSNRILWVLSDGRAYTAIEVANYAGTSREDVFRYLKQLKNANLIAIEKHPPPIFQACEQ
jgi:predicted ArsR family transcriptional regulator